MFSGNLVRGAHYERYTSVGPVDPGHSQQSPGRGIFEPTPEAATPPAPGDIWTPYDATPHTGLTPPRPTHVASYGPAAPIPSGVDGERGQNTVNDRMIRAHEPASYVPEVRAPYKAATQGRIIEHVQGRGPAPYSMEAFLTGRNGYEFSNPTSDVYGGERYRLGTLTQMFGRYEYWTKQGQDAMVRPVVTEAPILPVDKPPIPGAAPYTRNSNGTDRSLYPAFQDPRAFTTPSETGMSDYVMSRQATPNPGGFYEDGGRL